MGSMLRRIGLYLILAVYLFTISTVASAASNQTESGSLSVKQKEESPSFDIHDPQLKLLK
jgi:hypothetical protein